MSPETAKQTFLDYLREQNVISEDQRQRVIAEADRLGRPVDDMVVDLDILGEERFLEAKSGFLGVPYRALYGQVMSPKVLTEIPEETARTYEIIPLARGGQNLDVGMVNPDDVRAQEALRFLSARSGLTTRRFLVSKNDFSKVLRSYRSLGGEVKAALTELEKELAEETLEAREEAERKAEKVLEEEAPVTKMVAVIIRHAAEGKASDIHIEPTRKELRVRFRVDGVLHTSIMLPHDVHAAVVSRIKILADLKIDETRIPQDGRFRATIEGREIDFRISTFPTANGEKVAIRLLDPVVNIKTLEEHGLVGRNVRVVKEGITRPFGMVLLTGPTGSGKSTTLYGLLKILNKEGVNIVSLEDPVEYFVDGVNQSQIHEEIGYTFASGLRHILRGDPNIIMVGEIRDAETAQLAVHSALTGHLVLSTLHTNNSIGVIPRLIDMGVEPYLVPPTVAVAIAQRLVPRLCANCKRSKQASPSQTRLIEKALEGLPEEDKSRVSLEKPYQLSEAPGCDRCGKKGRSGRVAIFEALVMTPQLEGVILSRDLSETRLAEEAKRQGMITLLQDGVLKVLEGLIAIEDVLRVVEEQEIQNE